MHVPTKLLSAALPLVIGCALAAAAVAQASESEGYFMMAKVTKINSDGTIDFWPTSVRETPRKKPPATGLELPQLPKVIATLEFKSTGAASRLRKSVVQGSRISLRGKCEDLERAARVPVIQVRFGASQQWQQANLGPKNRVGQTGFKQVAAGVCPTDAANQATAVDPD